MEELNNELKHQDERIEDMKEKIEMLQAKVREELSIGFKLPFSGDQKAKFVPTYKAAILRIAQNMDTDWGGRTL